MFLNAHTADADLCNRTDLEDAPHHAAMAELCAEVLVTQVGMSIQLQDRKVGEFTAIRFN